MKSMEIIYSTVFVSIVQERYQTPFLVFSRTPSAVHHRRQYSTPDSTINSPLNFHLSPDGSVSQAFSNEMLEWYDGDGNPTSV